MTATASRPLLETTPTLTGPFFEIGPKSRLRLAQLEMLTVEAGRVGGEYDVAMVLTVPTAHLSALSATGSGVLLFAQHMDPDPMGDAMGRVFAESLVDAGASGVMLNHDSNPLSAEVLATSVRRAQACGLDTIVCAGSEQDVLDAIPLNPSAILFEPPELIGKAVVGGRDWIAPINERVRALAPHILLMHAGGVSAPDVAMDIMATGADGTGSTSGVLGAPEPLKAIAGFVAAARQGWEAARFPSTSSIS